MAAQRQNRDRPAVALLIETSNAYSRDLLQGIRDYLRTHDDEWTVHLTERGRGTLNPWFKTWQGAGIIARIDTPEIERVVRAKRVPTVNVSGQELAPEFSTVIADGRDLARLAAEHLLERGFRHFGYCGDVRFAWSEDYRRHFVAHLRATGCACSEFDSRPGDAANWKAERQRLVRWVEGLRKPAGVMVCYDVRGQHLLEICRQRGIAVPEEIAVIGQHNDELICSFCDPPLSSVLPDARRAGFEAAALLARMMRGRRLRARTIRIPALGVVTRQSTDVVAVQDPQLAAAVRFIRENACRGTGVPDVLRAVPMARTAFERRFRAHFGTSPYEAILRLRLQQARQLLATTRLSVAEVAARAGFSSGEYLCVAFKKHGWPSPKSFRPISGPAK